MISSNCIKYVYNFFLKKGSLLKANICNYFKFKRLRLKKKFLLLSSRILKMIQRIQTLYLLLVAIVSGGLIFVFNLWTVANEQQEFVLDLFSKSEITFKLIPIAFLVSSLVALISIFNFKKRQLQFVLGRIIVLINLFLLGLLIYLSLTLPGETAVSKKGIGMFLPVVAILFAVLANKAIKRDEDLVKSVDRLR